MTAFLEGSRRSRGVTCALMVALVALALTASAAVAQAATFSATQTIPVPPASNFAGSGGGDGWAVALSNEAVYNVFHHQATMQLACHLQTDASPCFAPETITDAEGHNFASSGQPGLYLDQHTGKLYVYGTRTSDNTPGVVCIDTTIAATNPDPFCGFTALTAVGEAEGSSWSNVSSPMLIGNHWYAFNDDSGAAQEGGKNTLLCFDVSTDTACSGQPYDIPLGAGKVTSSLPGPPTAAIGSEVIVPIPVEGANELACWNDATQSSCGGSWPAATTASTGSFGSPFPMLDATGKVIGVCLPTGTVPCFNLAGEPASTPPGLSASLDGGSSVVWNGPGLILGPRVYVPQWDNVVACYDYSTDASCTHFPKTFNGLDLLYTVNRDPQRPTCIWVNSDNGPSQIQDFDAYTGEACGQGTIRVLASQFVVPQPQCTPASYVSLQVLKPARSTYTGGSIAFADGDGNPIGLPERPLDETGTASLEGLELNTPTGLPQFLFTLNGEAEQVGAVEVKLTWTGNYEATCVGEHTSVTAPSTPPPTPTPTPKATPTGTITTVAAPKSGVLAFGSAHLASAPRACVASSGYLASVSGSQIATVTYTLDGHRLKTLSHGNSKGAFALRIHVAGGSHHLSIKVTFASASHTAPITIRRTLARCAAVHHVVTPRFTG